MILCTIHGRRFIHSCNISFKKVMTTLLEPIGDKTNKIYSVHKSSNDYSKHVLKSKENILKSKCNKALKRKLKQYKLRRDGKEDQDVLDVSQTLITSLRIKSPNNKPHLVNIISDTDEVRASNYLSKMARKKRETKHSTEDKSTPNGNVVVTDNIPTTPVPSVVQGKKQTNAFQLMMDSRNKSIGSNSPGKERLAEDTKIHEINEKKDVKAKRNLSLQRMAEAKGSLKKIEMEEYREECIQTKMLQRAERLKSMVLINETKKKKLKSVTSNDLTSSTVNKICDSKRLSGKHGKPLEIINIFDDNDEQSDNSKLHKEDEEFLRKLSPSIRKRENMLSYFKRVEKETEESPKDSNNVVDDEQCFIKVKLTPRNKKKSKKTRLINNEKNSHDTEKSHINERRKRKRDINIEHNQVKSDNIDDLALRTDDHRPKRNIKKPIKYTEEFQLSSSDEELHIFTPKKKKHTTNKTEKAKSLKFAESVDLEKTVMGDCNGTQNTNGLKVKSEQLREIPNAKKKHININSECRTTKNNMQSQKSAKLAPIFMSKSQVNPISKEDKQRFLHSGVPDKLKNISAPQVNTIQLESFPVTVHIQQKTQGDIDIALVGKYIYRLTKIDNDDCHINNECHNLENFLKLNSADNMSNIPSMESNVDLVLKNIKSIYPRFPVYRTYRLLKEKNNGQFREYSYINLDNSADIINCMVESNCEVEPDKLNWTEKYKPTLTKHILGNFESIKEIRKWLVSWTEYEVKTKNRPSVESDSSDFYYSDNDSKGMERNMNNLLLITGPVGTGKTSSVYAVAAELAIKVIEVNASSKRTGKIMLQDLQEATQSHKVDRAKSGTESSQKSQEISPTVKSKKKCGRPKKLKCGEPKTSAVIKSDVAGEPSSSQDGVRTGMSLILIDDADIVFEQDDGFNSAISQLIHCSKRPVILVTSSLTCAHLQKFLHCSKIINMRPFLPRMLGMWLDILCLADTGTSCPGLGSKILELFKGDIRKAMNCLQLYINTHRYISSMDNNIQEDNCLKNNYDDENSSMSWADHDGVEEKNLKSNNDVLDQRVIKYLIDQQLCLSSYHLRHTSELFNIWWSLPSLLQYNNIDSMTRDVTLDKRKMKLAHMETIASTLETMSMIDLFSKNMHDTKPNLSSNPWCSWEQDSLTEDESYATYDHCHEVTNDISYELVASSITYTQRLLGVEQKTDIKIPEMLLQRQKNKTVSRHHALTSYLNPSAMLDRRAVALDYWSSCRTICRIEKNKTDNNNKRNNRFCHYLKSLNVLRKNDYFDSLSESLHSVNS